VTNAVSKPSATDSTSQAIAGRQADRSFTDIPNTTMRNVIASRLTLSKTTIPHHYVTQACRIDKLMQLRNAMKDKQKSLASVNDFVIRAVALALRLVPELNAKWDEKQGKVQNSEVDVSVAVATPSGLITPIVKAADRKNVNDISTTVRDLATRARDNKLKPDEFQGGSFTISNLGMFGVSEFSAVINPPQSCILAVGGTQKRVILEQSLSDATNAGNAVHLAENPGKPVVASFMTVTLSCDERVVAADAAGRWLAVFQSLIERPEQLGA
jgi:pyruvate dehydrogenase E2 component (dihydrolipoamide acetyltransferase)